MHARITPRSLHDRGGRLEGIEIQTRAANCRITRLESLPDASHGGQFGPWRIVRPAGLAFLELGASKLSLSRGCELSHVSGDDRMQID